MKKTLVAAGAGLILGIIGARYVFVGSWLNLVPWGIAGFAIGCWGAKNESIANGVIFGFVLTLVFLIAGYSGSYTLLSRVPFFVILSAFGSICGMALGFVGFAAKSKFFGAKKEN